MKPFADESVEGPVVDRLRLDAPDVVCVAELEPSIVDEEVSREANARGAVDRDGCHVVLDAVPAWVCHQCGEPYFEEREVDTIQALIQSVEQNAN